jgi:hypothetical protein
MLRSNQRGIVADFIGEKNSNTVKGMNDETTCLARVPITPSRANFSRVIGR